MRRLSLDLLFWAGIIAVAAIMLYTVDRYCRLHAATATRPVAAADDAHEPPAPPVPGWTTPATVIRVIDGDTVEIEVRRTLKVRLLDCWAPERSDPGGAESTEHLRALIEATDNEVILHVPLTSARVEDAWTFGRVLGALWPAHPIDGDNRSLSTQQRAAGHAQLTKSL